MNKKNLHARHTFRKNFAFRAFLFTHLTCFSNCEPEYKFFPSYLIDFAKQNIKKNFLSLSFSLSRKEESNWK